MRSVGIALGAFIAGLALGLFLRPPAYLWAAGKRYERKMRKAKVGMAALALLLTVIPAEAQVLGLNAGAGVTIASSRYWPLQPWNQSYDVRLAGRAEIRPEYYSVHIALVGRHDQDTPDYRLRHGTRFELVRYGRGDWLGAVVVEANNRDLGRGMRNAVTVTRSDSPHPIMGLEAWAFGLGGLVRIWTGNGVAGGGPFGGAVEWRLWLGRRLRLGLGRLPELFPFAMPLKVYAELVL